MEGVSTIRPAGLDDLEALAALEASNRSNPWSRGVFRDELTQDNRIYVVAVEESVIGFAGVMVVGEEAHVTDLLVDPASRGKGVGRRLMVEVFVAAIGVGARHVTLEVRTKNEAARALYASLGLAPVGIRKGYYPDDDAMILWAHDIDGPEYRERYL